jgi:hypothetical protein
MRGWGPAFAGEDSAVEHACSQTLSAAQYMPIRTIPKACRQVVDAADQTTCNNNATMKQTTSGSGGQHGAGPVRAP